MNDNIRRWSLISISLLCFLSVTVWWLQRGSAGNHIPQELQNIILQTPKLITPFQLSNQQGESFTHNNFLGKWTFLFFGYTHCPDICPTTMSELNSVAKQLNSKPSLQNKIQYVFVSVDPQRDTIEHLRNYVAYFNEKFIALTGETGNINVLTKQLGIKHSKGEGTENNYTVNHSSAILLIDPKGRYYAKFKAPHYAETLTSKLTLIQLVEKERQT